MFKFPVKNKKPSSVTFTRKNNELHVTIRTLEGTVEVVGLRKEVHSFLQEAGFLGK
jgi:hypothetical protein